MNESELIETGPNYSHTTNGRELEYQLCRIFVGHLPVDYLSKDDIYSIFEAYGKILAIRNELNCHVVTTPSGECYFLFRNEVYTRDIVSYNLRLLKWQKKQPRLKMDGE